MRASHWLSILSIASVMLFPLPTAAQGASPVGMATPIASLAPINLGTLGGPDSAAKAINNAGHVVGWSETADGTIHAFLWTNGQMADLGTLGGARSSASAINNVGQIVGWSDTAGGKMHAFFWTNGRMVDLGTLPGGDASRANDINDAGQIIGDSTTATVDTLGLPTRLGDIGTHGFVWESGQMTDLGVFPDGNTSYAHAINDDGLIVGSALLSGQLHGFTWDTGKMTDLGVLTGGHISSAMDVNNAGRVVGWARTADGDDHAVQWAGGQITDLGTLPGGIQSMANGINAADQVAGWALTAEHRHRAVLWTAGSMIDLGTLPGGENSEGNGINAAGQIAGISSTVPGASLFDPGIRAVLWPAGAGAPAGTPGAATPTATPDAAPSATPTSQAGIAPSPATVRWCLDAGDDMEQAMSVFFEGMFQPRSLLVTHDVIVAPTQAGSNALIALNPRTGEERWRLPVATGATSTFLAEAPAQGRAVYVLAGGETSMVGAVDLGSGENAWLVSLTAVIRRPPVVDGDTVYVAVDGRGVIALDAATSALRWVAALDRSPGPIVVVDPMTLVAGLADGAVVGLDRATGNELWRRVVAPASTDSADSWSWDGTTGNGVVVLTAWQGEQELTGSTIYALDGTTGATLWSRSMGKEFATSPALAEGTVYIGSSDGAALALNARTGAERWAQSLGAAPTSWLPIGIRPSVFGGLVVIAGVVAATDPPIGGIAVLDASTGQVRSIIALGGVMLLDSAVWESNGLWMVRGITQDITISICALESAQVGPPSPTVTPAP